MAKKPVIAAIVVAAGKGERAGADGNPTPKQYRRLAGKAVLSRSIEGMLAADLSYVIAVIHPEHADRYASLGLSDERLLPAVNGGATRQQSVLEGLAALRKYEPDLVLIHDAARPLAGPALIARVFAALETHDGAVPAIPVTDTIKRSPDGTAITATEDRRKLFAAQTPQGFRFEKILAAHREAAVTTEPFTDDASIGEWAGLDVVITLGSDRNLKVTLPDDFARAERLLGGERMETRTGFGIDVHPFEPGDHVWLGGVRIPHTHRLAGHSDADAALHAITDALYGAIGEGDIGTHFPPSDPQWKGAASKIFLEHAVTLVRDRGGRVVNLDLTIVCEAPRIAPHAAAMKQAIADICGISPSRIAVKATTSEAMGFTGRKEGLFASAVATVELPYEA